MSVLARAKAKKAEEARKKKEAGVQQENHMTSSQLADLIDSREERAKKLDEQDFQLAQAA